MISHHIELDLFSDHSKIRGTYSHRISLKDVPAFLYIRNEEMTYKHLGYNDILIRYDDPLAPNIPEITYDELIGILDEIIVRAEVRLYVV